MKKVLMMALLCGFGVQVHASSSNLSIDVGHCIGFMVMTKELNQHRPETQEKIRTMENVLLGMSDEKKAKLSDNDIRRAANEYTTGIVSVIEEGEKSGADISEDFKQKVEYWVDLGVNACVRAGSQ